MLCDYRLRNLADQSTGVGYKKGSLIRKRVNSGSNHIGSSYLTIPQSTLSGQCLDTYPVRYGMLLIMRCA